MLAVYGHGKIQLSNKGCLAGTAQTAGYNNGITFTDMSAFRQGS